MEVVQPDDRHRRHASVRGAPGAPGPGCAGARGRRGRRRGWAPGRWCDPVDRALGDAVAPGDEGRPHVDVVVQVLHVGHVAVLAEERRAGDQGAGGGGVELVRRVGEHDEVAGAGRVGHVGRRALAVGDGAGLGLGERPVDHRPALGLAVAGPVVGIGEPLVGGPDLGHHGGLVGRRHLLQPPPAGSRPARLRYTCRAPPAKQALALPIVSPGRAGSSRSAAATATAGRPGPGWRRWPGTAGRTRGRTTRTSSGCGPAGRGPGPACRRRPRRPGR